MPRRPRNTKIIEALNKSGGIISSAAISLKISRQSLSKWVNTDPELKEARENADESLNDLAESQLVKGIKNGDTALIIFRLKTKAKHRGYVERQEVVFDKNDVIEVGYTSDED